MKKWKKQLETNPVEKPAEPAPVAQEPKVETKVESVVNVRPPSYLQWLTSRKAMK